jgi:hypothetical protein
LERVDGKQIKVCFYYVSMSVDASMDVFLHSYATHMACVITADMACCVYPWALGDRETCLLRHRLTRRQREEIKVWVYNVGGSREACLEYYSKHNYVEHGDYDHKTWCVDF